MYKKKIRNKSILIRLEQHVKKFQTLYTIAIPSAISILALYISINSNELAKEQMEKEKIPLWDYKFISETDSDLKTLLITSIKTDFKIINFEIITPEFEYPRAKFVSDGNSLNTFSLEQHILEHYNALYNVPSVFTTAFNTYSLKRTYPIIIKINYLYNDERLSYNSFFKVKFKLYGSSKLSLTSIIFMDQIQEYEEIEAQSKLKQKFISEDFGKSFFATSDSLYDNLFKTDTLIKQFLILLDGYSENCDYEVKGKDTTTNSSDYIGYTLPVFLCDSNYYKNFSREKDSIFNHLTGKNLVLKSTILKIDSFLNKNKHDFKFEYTDVKKSTWADSETLYDWEDMLEDEKIRIWKHFYEIH